jgi:hypothetical protein
MALSLNLIFDFSCFSSCTGYTKGYSRSGVLATLATPQAMLLHIRVGSKVLLAHQKEGVMVQPNHVPLKVL